MSKEKQEIIFYLFIPLPLIPPPLASPLRNRIPEGGASPPARSRRVPGPGTPGMWTVATPGPRTHDLLSVKQTC